MSRNFRRLGDHKLITNEMRRILGIIKRLLSHSHSLLYPVETHNPLHRSFPAKTPCQNNTSARIPLILVKVANALLDQTTSNHGKSSFSFSYTSGDACPFEKADCFHCRRLSPIVHRSNSVSASAYDVSVCPSLRSISSTICRPWSSGWLIAIFTVPFDASSVFMPPFAPCVCSQ